jgi:hypothetical protein
MNAPRLAGPFAGPQPRTRLKVRSVLMLKTFDFLFPRRL